MSQDRDGRSSGSDRQDWQPGDYTGWEDFHRQMFDLASAPNAFIRWKIKSTGVNIARALMGARNRGRAAWTAAHGPDPAGWPLPHPPAVLWLPYAGYASCLRCHWLQGTTPSPDDVARSVEAAAGAARRHAAEHLPPDSPALELLDAPLPVWRRDAPWDGPGPTQAR